MNPSGIAKLHPPPYCVIPYQAFEAAGLEQGLPRNEINGIIIADHTLDPLCSSQKT